MKIVMATKKAIKSATPDFLSIPMVQDKITKGTLRFHAQSKEGELSIPTLYIKKEAFEKIVGRKSTA